MLVALAMRQEAARCLLCYEPPCSAACPAGLDPAGRILSLVLENQGGAAEGIDGGCILCGGCERVCVRGKIDRPVKIVRLMRELEGGKEYE